MSDVQDSINKAVEQLTQIAKDFANEWAAITDHVKNQAPNVDTSKLDQLVVDFQGMDSSWSGALPAPAVTTPQAMTAPPPVQPQPTDITTEPPPAGTTTPPPVQSPPASQPAEFVATEPAATEPAATGAAEPAPAPPSGTNQ